MKIIKIPQLSDELELIPITKKNQTVPFFEEGVRAGFPSPAEGLPDQRLSLDDRYLSRPESTYIVRVKGESMYPSLMENDLLIVRSDLELYDRCIGIFSVNHNEFTVKRYLKNEKKLQPDNTHFSEIKLTDEDTVICLGVVHSFVRDL